MMTYGGLLNGLRETLMSEAMIFSIFTSYSTVFSNEQAENTSIYKWVVGTEKEKRTDYG